MKSRTLPILIIAVAVVSIVAILVSRSQEKVSVQPPVVENIPPKDMPPEIQVAKSVPTIVQNPAQLSQETKQAITQKVFDWLTGLKNENKDNIYPGNLQCDDMGVCSQGTSNRASVFAAVWSRFQRFKLTKNPEDLAVIKGDLDTFTNIHRTNPIQVGFWGCRLLYEIHQSTLPEINPLKNNLQSLCQNILYSSDALDEIDRVIAANQIQEANLDAMLEGRNSPSSLLPAKTYYVEYAGLASEYVSRYQWFKDKKDLDRAKMFFAIAGGGFNLQDDKQRNENFPALGVAALDLHGATNNSKYLDLATLLIKEKQQGNCQSLLDCALTAFFAQEFSQVSQNDEYKSLRDRMLAAAVAGGYDDEGYPAVVKTLGAFHLFNTTSLFYPTHESFLLTGLLMKQ